MSLLKSANTGAEDVPYFIENIGFPGGVNALAPCIKGSSLGTVVVGNASAGLVLRGDTLANNNRIGGGQVSGGQLQIGNSTTSFQNIVLTDGITTVNGTLSVPAGGDIFVGDDISLGGDLTFTNGGTGSSISGFYSVNTAPIDCPDASDTVVPTPGSLTTGWHIVSCSTVPPGQTQQQVATIVRYTVGVGFLFGGCVSNIAGTGRFGFNVSADRSTLVLSNSTGAAQNGITVNFSKLMN